MKRTATQDAATSMWFGPRLGRRRRSDEKQEVKSELQALADALDSGRLIFAIPGENFSKQLVHRYYAPDLHICVNHSPILQITIHIYQFIGKYLCMLQKDFLVNVQKKISLLKL